MDKQMDKQMKKQVKFIDKANIRFNNKYDYSKVKFTKTKAKVIIVCPHHGDTIQTPNGHIGSKHGCADCATEAKAASMRKTLEKFIEQAKSVHGNSYDYSKTIYVNDDTNVEIICNKHKTTFSQEPSNHLRGYRCPTCGRESAKALITNTTEKFTEKAKNIHGDTYGYDKVVYICNSDPVIIICPKHGEFSQRPSDHLSGKGCRECGTIKAHKPFIKPTEQLKSEFEKIHAGAYDYSLMINEGRHHKTKIICPKHGMFEQEVKSHSKGHGCQQCAISNNCSKDQIEWLDLLSKSIGSDIQHALNLGEFLIEDSRYKADGFLEINDKKIVFEFHGCYWHGCPKCHPNCEEINEVAKETFGVLHKRTCERRQFIMSKGYKYIDIYECEFKALKSDEEKMKTHILHILSETSNSREQPVRDDNSHDTIAIHAVAIHAVPVIIKTPIPTASTELLIETDDILEEEELAE